MIVDPSTPLRERLERLGLPHLGGRRVLALGADAAEFSRFADFQLASSAVAARPGEDVEAPGAGFDVVVLLDDTGPEAARAFEALPQWVEQLAPGGVLILERTLRATGNAPGQGDDHAMSRAELKTALAPFAVKRMGTAHPHPVRGRGFFTEVHHVARRLPVVCLMMAPPGYGKTALAQQVFGGRDPSLPIVGADSLVHRVTRGDVDAGAELRAALEQGFSPLRIDEAVERIVEAGLVDSWVDVVLRVVAPGDFVLEGYFPARGQHDLVLAFRDRGYLAVRMDWERPRFTPMDSREVAAELERFEGTLRAPGEADAPATDAIAAAGNIDAVSPVAEGLALRGWAVTAGGRVPERFEVRRGRAILEVVRVEFEERADVREHLDLPHARIGFRLFVVDRGNSHKRRAQLSVRVADQGGTWSGPLHWSR